jgi:hypothetical protein
MRLLSRISSVRLLAAFLALWIAPTIRAQDQVTSQVQTTPQDQVTAQDATIPQGSESISPVPIFSAGLAYNSFVQGGTDHVHPLVSPVILIPLGQNWLIENRETFEIDLAPQPGSNGNYKGHLQKEVDYLQLDYAI